MTTNIGTTDFTECYQNYFLMLLNILHSSLYMLLLMKNTKVYPNFPNDELSSIDGANV